MRQVARVAGRLLVDRPNGILVIGFFELGHIELLVEEDWVLCWKVDIAIKFLIVEKNLVFELNMIALLPDLILG